MRWLRWLGRAFLLLVVLNLGVSATLAWPGWAFSHAGGTDRLRLHSATPVPPEADIWAAAVMERLDASALPPGDQPVDLYITGDGWRYQWFFMGAPGAGGLVYGGAPGRRMFLAGADFASDRLVMPDRIIPPPRTLSSFAVHEITHLTQIELLRRWGFIRLDPVIREGVADYVALGPASDALQAVIDSRDPALDEAPLRDAHGSYPRARVVVTHALQSKSLSALMGL